MRKEVVCTNREMHCSDGWPTIPHIFEYASPPAAQGPVVNAISISVNCSSANVLSDDHRNAILKILLKWSCVP